MDQALARFEQYLKRLNGHRQVKDWQSFRRADLEVWLQARGQDGVSDVTIHHDLGQLHGLVKFLEARGYPIDPGLFRAKIGTFIPKN